MKPLVVYYSRTGTIRKVGEAIARALNCDSEEITEKKGRAGSLGFLRSGMEATFGRLPTINAAAKDSASYDLIILGTPVWNLRMASPMRTYLTQHAGEFNKVAFFSTYGGKERPRVYADMEQLCRGAPVQVLGLQEREVKSGDYAQKVTHFVSALQSLE